MTHHENARQELERLEQELAARRERVSQLIGALEKKVSAGELLGHGGDLAKQFGRTAKEHPVPSLVAAAGLAWLYAVKDQRPGEHGAGEGKLHGLKDKTHAAGDAIRNRTHAGMEGARHLLEDNPAAAGAIAIGVGALLGALIPPTRKEDELWGETRDRLAERARSTRARRRAGTPGRARWLGPAPGLRAGPRRRGRCVHAAGPVANARLLAADAGRALGPASGSTAALAGASPHATGTGRSRRASPVPAAPDFFVQGPPSAFIPCAARDPDAPPRHEPASCPLRAVPRAAPSLRAVAHAAPPRRQRRRRGPRHRGR